MRSRHKAVTVLIRSVSHGDHGGLSDHGDSIAELLEQSGGSLLGVCCITAKQRATWGVVGLVELAED